MFFKTKEEKFWAWFVKNQAAFYAVETTNEPLFEQLSNQLKKVQDGLSFAFGAILEDGKRELVISAEGMKEFFPAVIELIKAAPTHPQWKFKAFRQRIASDELELNMGELTISYEDIFFRYLIEEGKVGIELNVRYFQDDNYFINGVFILLDALLGEYDVGTQIGFIEWVALDEKDMPELLPFLMLRDIVDKNKASKN